MNMQGLFILTFLFTFATCQNPDWKSMKHVRTNVIKQLQDRGISPKTSDNRAKYFGELKKNEAHFQRALQNILKVRVPGTDGSREVREFIENEMSNIGWVVERDTFEENTVEGRFEFNNIIATLDPEAPRRMVIACHYDSKIRPTGFLGATDSAVPCAQMINLAYTMKMDLDDHRNGGSDLTLQFIFFDGEEAFQQWTATDSIYGARHLASKWQSQPFEHAGVQGQTLDRIDIFVLLDLLGAKDPTIISSQPDTDPWFKKLVDAEDALTATKAVSGPRIFQTIPARRLGIEDDHIPFLQRGVPILHLIPVPFPDVWHTLGDNGDIIDYPTVEKLNMILRVFVSEYLELA